MSLASVIAAMPLAVPPVPQGSPTEGTREPNVNQCGSLGSPGSTADNQSSVDCGREERLEFKNEADWPLEAELPVPGFADVTPISLQEYQNLLLKLIVERKKNEQTRR